jgi:hypothetical protein
LGEIQNTLSELRALLAHFSGVSVESVDVKASRIDIVLLVERIESLGPIVYACDGANVGLHVWSVANGIPVQARANPASLRYRVSALGNQDATPSAQDRVQAFGVYLVNYAYVAELISIVEAGKLLASWNGKPIDSSNLG